MDLVDTVIFDELVKGQVNRNSKEQFVRIARQLESQGAQGIILGCTEIDMLLEPDDVVDLPLFNTTALHIDGAAMLAFQI